MKRSASRLLHLICLLCMAVMMSCNSVYFDQPQPVDAKNLSKVPDELQGVWKYAENQYDIPDSVIIDSVSYRTIDNQRSILMKSSLDDPESDYKIINDKIYSKVYNLSFPYKTVNDTLFFTERIETVYSLNDSSFLRKARNCYVYNMKKGPWWEIIIIQKKENREIRISYPAYESISKAGSKYYIRIDSIATMDPTGSEYFCHATLKKKDIEKIILPDGSDVLWWLHPDSTFMILGESHQDILE